MVKKKSTGKRKSSRGNKKKQQGGTLLDQMAQDTDKQTILDNENTSSNAVSNNNKTSDTDNDPPFKPLSEEEQADLPALLATSESPAFSSMMDLSSLGRALGVTVVEVNKCIACNQKKSRDEFFYNQWIKDDTYGPRCRSCVKRGEFRVVNQEQFWAGWPKDPLQVMWERGWIDCPRGQRPDPMRYPPERIGKMVVGMPDSKLLLENFELAGQYGYGGVEEELCCMPGCVVDANLKACSRCKRARYCCAEHQVLHYRHHKDQCVSWSRNVSGS